MVFIWIFVFYIVLSCAEKTEDYTVEVYGEIIKEKNSKLIVRVIGKNENIAEGELVQCAIVVNSSKYAKRYEGSDCQFLYSINSWYEKNITFVGPTGDYLDVAVYIKPSYSIEYLEAGKFIFEIFDEEIYNSSYAGQLAQGVLWINNKTLIEIQAANDYYTLLSNGGSEEAIRNIPSILPFIIGFIGLVGFLLTFRSSLKLALIFLFMMLFGFLI